MRASAVFVVVLLGSSGRQEAEAALDAGSEAAPRDGSGIDTAPSDAPTETTPDVGGPPCVSIDVYFPKGRVAGGEVVLVGRTYGGSSVTTYGVLDATLSARDLRVADARREAKRGRFSSCLSTVD